MKGLMIFGRVQNQFNLMGWYLQTTVSYSQRTLYPLDTSWSQEEMGEDDCFLWTGLSISAVDSWLPHFQAPQRIGWMVNFSFPFLFTVLKKNQPQQENQIWYAGSRVLEDPCYLRTVWWSYMFLSYTYPPLFPFFFCLVYGCVCECVWNEIDRLNVLDLTELLLILDPSI